ncbi:Enoyl-CoA hydratase domain-containing protein 3, mitochondrial [Tyrophagus putrescentiae]|nr:Enoyl-CoA hydratase domain-containing protein 3, mitochondrial [Tyrophagus putrescentiae]
MFTSLSAAQEQQQQHPIVLVTEDKGPLSGVRRVTLNNPKKRNALSLGMIEQLAQHLQQDPEGKLRAIVINANHGGKVFSSGHDLKEMAIGEPFDASLRQSVYECRT